MRNVMLAVLAAAGVGGLQGAPRQPAPVLARVPDPVGPPLGVNLRPIRLAAPDGVLKGVLVTSNVLRRPLFARDAHGQWVRYRFSPGADVILEVNRRPVADVRAVRAGPAARLRFLAEAEALSALDHPHVVRVIEEGDWGGGPFLSMEYLPGGTLADRLTAGRLAPRAAAELVAALADGVGAAHARGIIHHDLKPANVLFDAAGRPKVADFGLAKRDGGDALTATGAVMGTPAYMAPEQARGEGKFVGPAADVWALGVVLYECLAGRKPFAGATTQETLQRVIRDEPAGVRAVAPGVPRDLHRIAHKCLAKPPHERYQTAADLAAHLRLFLAGRPAPLRAAGPAERLAKWARRKPTLAAAYGLALAAVAAGAVAGGFATLYRRADAAREQLAAVDYARTIQLAQQRWEGGRLDDARALLAGTRPDLRGWEHDYLSQLCRAELAVLTADGHDPLAVAALPDGRHAVTARFASGTRPRDRWSAPSPGTPGRCWG